MKKRVCFLLCIVLTVMFTVGLTDTFAKPKKLKKNQLVITSAFYDDEANTLTLYGQKFGGKPEVMIEDELYSIASSNGEEILIEFEAALTPGTYRVAVARKGRFHSASQSDVMDVTIGAVGPVGPKGDQGDKGEDGSVTVLNPLCKLYELMKQDLPAECYDYCIQSCIDRYNQKLLDCENSSNEYCEDDASEWLSDCKFEECSELGE